MGKYNSSITRVWPVFDYLLDADPSGTSWLPRLVQMSRRGERVGELGAINPSLLERTRAVPRNMRTILGEGTAASLMLRECFEYPLPPSDRFLKWLITHPTAMRWPSGKDRKFVTYGQDTQLKRERLMAGDPEIQNEALHELRASGAAGSARKWWAFEGFTSVDCYLETDSFVLLIEGKRTEPVSASTHWYPRRNQVVRNVEAAREIAASRQSEGHGGKRYGVLVCADTDPNVREQDFVAGLPHYNESECSEARNGYLGWVAWAHVARELTPGLALPDTVADTLEIFSGSVRGNKGRAPAAGPSSTGRPRVAMSAHSRRMSAGEWVRHNNEQMTSHSH